VWARGSVGAKAPEQVADMVLVEDQVRSKLEIGFSEVSAPPAGL
jgi:hypothetical protein